MKKTKKFFVNIHHYDAEGELKTYPIDDLINNLKNAKKKGATLFGIHIPINENYEPRGVISITLLGEKPETEKEYLDRIKHEELIIKLKKDMELEEDNKTINKLKEKYPQLFK